jgi:hypothetical protein
MKKFEITLVSPLGREFKLTQLRTQAEVEKVRETARAVGFRVKRLRTIVSVDRVWS